MANISHSVLAGTEIHEPKGIVSANLGQVYISDGNGSGNWGDVGTASFTGMIADFTWPVPQSGWLECDGSDINITTYGALFAVMTIQMPGTRTSASNLITSLSSTSNMRVGYYIYGVGIAEDTTILTINSSSQVTMSSNASSTGTGTIIVSPWRLGNGIIRLPDFKTDGRYRRSRTATTAVGQQQASTNLTHTHSFSGTTGGQSQSHNHVFSATTGNMLQNNPHGHTYSYWNGSSYPTPGYSSANPGYGESVSRFTSSDDISHTHNVNGTTYGASQDHTHNITGTTNATGDATESRPPSLVVMTCVKT